MFFNKKNRSSERQIYDDYHQHVYKTAYFIVKDQGMAQDITQETFMKIFKNMDTLNDEKKMSSWITTITTRTSIDFLRKKKKWNETLTEDVILEKGTKENRKNEIETNFHQNEIKEKIKQQIDSLKPEHKEVLVLKYIEDLKDEEIAEVIHEKIGTVKSRIHRAKQQLKASLQQEIDTMGGDVS